MSAPIPQCPRCGRDNRTDAAFCDGCGARLAAARDATARHPGDYTPRHLAEKILTQRSALEGERKQVTVLFVDVKSSLELAEEVDAEEWHRILDRFFHVLADGVHRFEGTVNQYTGDGIMALFGAPIAHEDHAQRACHAALNLARELRRYAQRLRRELSLDFHVRMGMNSGEVVVGRIGDDLRMDYTAQGQTVGLAARLEKLAEPGKVYVSEQTAALVAGLFELEDLGEFELRGASQPTRAYALEGVGNLRTRFDVARWRGFSRFVGREGELAQLEEALAGARAGHGEAIRIVGEAGVGKSRLCWEFLTRARRRGVAVVGGNGVSHGRGLPLLPILELLRDAFEIRERDDPLTARRKIAGALMTEDREIADDLPLIFDVLGVPDPERPAPLVEGEGRQRRVFAILRRFLAARAAAGSLVILFEDLQWFDTASQDFLAGLIAEIASTQGLLLLTLRPELRASFVDGDASRLLELAPLGEEAAARLLGDLLGNAPGVEPLASAIRERARGNPFFIEEVVQSLVDAGQLSGTRGAYRLERPVSEIAIPQTVHALISARIDRLPENEKRVLDTAAVIGKNFSGAVLERVSTLGEEELEASLRALIAAEFFIEQETIPERLLEFKHPLTQEVAYQSQLSDQRGAVHAAIARTLEEQSPEALDESAALIALHWEQAGNALAASRWTHRAARWLGPSNPAEAMELWRRLLRLAGPELSSPEIGFLAARACRWLLFLGASQGMPEEEAAQLFESGTDYARRTGDQRGLALTLANYGFYRAQVVVDTRSAVAYTAEAREIVKQAKSPRIELRIGVRAAQALGFAGRFVEATELGRELLARLALPDAPQIDPLDHVTLYATVGDAMNETGHPAEGAVVIERGLELAAERDLLLNAGYCHNAYVRAIALTGTLDKVDFHALAAMRAAERTGNKAMLVYAHDVLGLAHQLHGRWDEAVACGERAIELSERDSVARISDNAHRAHLAHAYLRAGQLERAREMVDSAVRACARCGPRYTPRAHIVRARLLIESEGLAARAAIEADLDAAQWAIDQTQARIYAPIVLEDHALLAGLDGDAERRANLLHEARRHWLDMGLPIPARRVELLLERDA